MTNRRIFETVGVRYSDIGAVQNIVARTKEMLEQHKDIDTELIIMVNLNKFGASSIDFFIYCFTKTTKWAEYHEVKQDVLFKVESIISEENAEIAFPTQTLHVAPVELLASHLSENTDAKK
jgi:MscS family membrane protein